jgi:uncharacterized membrane protein YhhN
MIFYKYGKWMCGERGAMTSPVSTFILMLYGMLLVALSTKLLMPGTALAPTSRDGTALRLGRGGGV